MKTPFQRSARFSAVLLFTLSLLLVSEPSFAQPTITSHPPDQNSLDVSADTNIVVQFSENIENSTVDKDTFNVDGTMTGEIAGAFTGGGTDTITFDPTTDFDPGEVVTVTLTTGIENTSGAALAASLHLAVHSSVTQDHRGIRSPADHLRQRRLGFQRVCRGHGR